MSENILVEHYIADNRYLFFSEGVKKCVDIHDLLCSGSDDLDYS